MVPDEDIDSRFCISNLFFGSIGHHWFFKAHDFFTPQVGQLTPKELKRITLGDKPNEPYPAFLLYKSKIMKNGLDHKVRG